MAIIYYKKYKRKAMLLDWYKRRKHEPTPQDKGFSPYYQYLQDQNMREIIMNKHYNRRDYFPLLLLIMHKFLPWDVSQVLPWEVSQVCWYFLQN